MPAVALNLGPLQAGAQRAYILLVLLLLQLLPQ
jgi:hypothetical protein